jgi:hypothetical protein
MSIGMLFLVLLRDGCALCDPQMSCIHNTLLYCYHVVNGSMHVKQKLTMPTDGQDCRMAFSSCCPLSNATCLSPDSRDDLSCQSFLLFSSVIVVVIVVC